jgi:uncharacterized C2H2 Zn-finger protein
MATIRDRLLRRKAWAMAMQAFCYFNLLLVIPVAIRMRSFGGGTKLAIAVVGCTAVILAMRASSRWVRCPRCDFVLGGFGLRRKEKLQVNVCAHCGLSLDSPPEAGARP